VIEMFLSLEFEYCDLRFLCRNQKMKSFLSESVSGYFDVLPIQAGSDLTVEGVDCMVCVGWRWTVEPVGLVLDGLAQDRRNGS